MQDIPNSPNGVKVSSQPILPLASPETKPEIRDEEFNIQSYISILARRWWVIASVGLAVCAYQISIEMKRPPVYQEQFQLLIEPPEQDITNPLEGASAVLNNTNTGKDYYTTQITILLSNKLISPVLKKIYREYPDLNENNFNYGYFIQKLKIIQPNGGSVLTISYQDTNQERVKFVLEQLAKAYLDYTRQDQRITSQQKLSFVSQQLPLLEQKVVSFQQELLQLQQNYNFFDPESQGKALNENLNTILQQKKDVLIQIQQNQILSAQLRQQLGIDDSLAIALNALSQSPQYIQLIGRLNEINMQLAKDSTRLTEENILIQQLKEERNNLLPLINRQATGVLTPLPKTIPTITPIFLAPNDIRSDSLKKLLDTNLQLSILEQQQQTLLIYEKQARENLQKFSVVVSRYMDRQRQLQLATEGLNRLLEAEQTLEIETSKRFIPWRLISDITLPNEPINRLPQDILFAILKGLIVGVIAGVLVEKLDRTYHKAEDISQETGRTVLGTIPWESELSDISNRSKRAAHTNFLEAFSILFANVFFLRQKQSCRSFVITSPTSGDGKSTTSFFLALASAKLGQRVLLIDGDRYFPQGEKWSSLTQIFQSQKALDKSMSTKTITQENEPLLLMDNLYYFKIQNNALEPDKLMSSQSLLTLLNHWKESFDVILIDTPPLLGLSDTRLIARQTDGVLLVIRLDTTSKDSIKSALNELSLSDLKLLGIVANGVKRHSSSYNYYHYNRYYRAKAKQNA